MDKLNFKLNESFLDDMHHLCNKLVSEQNWELSAVAEKLKSGLLEGLSERDFDALQRKRQS